MLIVYLGELVLAGYILIWLYSVFWSLFLAPRVGAEYDSDGEVDNQWRWVNKGRWT